MPDPEELAQGVVEHVQSCSLKADLRITQHAAEEMIADAVSVEDLLEALATAELVEHYPEHRRGACSLVSGTNRTGRHLHVVCTSQGAPLVIITVYEPRPPKWLTPRERSR